MALTLADIPHLLKTLYPNGPIYEMMKESPALAFINKDTKFYGNFKEISVIHSGNQARSADISKALAHGGKHKGKAFLINRAHNYAVFSLDRETMLATENDSGALAKALQVETETAIQAFKNDLGNDLYGKGTGKRGQIATSGGISASTIQLQEPNDIVRFEVGMKVQLSVADGGGALRSSGAELEIATINRDAGSFTTTVAVTTGIAAAANGDFIFVSGDYDQKPKGFLAWNPLAAPVGGDNFFGVDRSTNVTALAGCRYNAASSASHEEALQTGIAKFGRFSCYPTHVFMHPDDMLATELSLGSRVVREDVEGPQGLGFGSIVIRGPKGKVRCFEDPWAVKGYALCEKMEAWTMHSLKEVPHFVVEDGNKLDRQATADGFDGRLAGYYQFATEETGQNGVITLPAL